MADAFLGFVFEHTPLPRGYGLHKLCVRTRTVLRDNGPGSTRWSHSGRAVRDDEELDEIFTSYLGYKSNIWNDPAFIQRAVRIRHELLTVLATANQKREMRRDRARRYVIDQLDFFSGWDEYVAQSDGYQLREDKPWWKPGLLLDTEMQRQDIGSSASALRRAGFTQISRAVYLERIHQPLIEILLTRKNAMRSELAAAAAVIALYTASRSEKAHLGELATNIEQSFVVAMLKRLRNQHCRIPMRPLYSLPREASNLRTLMVSRPEELDLDQAHDLVWDATHNSGVRVIEEADGQRVLFFDPALVNKKKPSKPNTPSREQFLAVELQEAQSDTLGALLKALDTLQIDHTVMEHVPRICAGVFAAAQRDRRFAWTTPGTFWDTEQGHRLCRIVGFNPDNWRHRSWVQQALHLMETIHLHRPVYQREANGRRIEAMWSGPLVETSKSRLTLSVEEREGFHGRLKLKSYSIAQPLWHMVLNESDGGTPAFMVLDRRVFELNDRSSKEFNIYWMLINRAYMGKYATRPEDQLQPDGQFSPKLATILSWSGIESSYNRPVKLRSFLHGALDLMVENGLLLEWECEAITDKNSGFEQLKESRVRVVFSESQLEILRDHMDATPTPTAIGEQQSFFEAALEA